MEPCSPEVLAAVEGLLAGEAQAIRHLSQTILPQIPQVLEILLPHRGHVIVSGMGKSGYIAQKIAATLTSTGTRAVYLHPAEAMHGDLGIYVEGDPTIILSKSGTSEEILRLIPLLKRYRSPMIAITAKKESELAQHADVVIDIGTAIENDPTGMVPTTSAVVSLAAGDAIACALMRAKGFSKKDFAKIHPAGQIGRNLLLTVHDVMTPIEDVALLDQEHTLREVVIAVTEKPLGGALILEENGGLLGIITDGDIRRALKLDKSIDKILAKDIMTTEPRVITEGACLGEALDVMERGRSQVYVLPVIDAQHRAVGLLRLHDAYRA